QSCGGDSKASVQRVGKRGVPVVLASTVAGFLGLHAVVGAGDGVEVVGVFEENTDVEELFGHLHDVAFGAIGSAQLDAGGGRSKGGEFVAEQAFDGGQLYGDLSVRNEEGRADRTHLGACGQCSSCTTSSTARSLCRARVGWGTRA